MTVTISYHDSGLVIITKPFFIDLLHSLQSSDRHNYEMGLPLESYLTFFSTLPLRARTTKSNTPNPTMKPAVVAKLLMLSAIPRSQTYV
jgi:hypothetical protein